MSFLERVDQTIRRSVVWRSLFRQPVMNNVFLHIHPVRVRQHAVKFGIHDEDIRVELDRPGGGYREAVDRSGPAVGVGSTGGRIGRFDGHGSVPLVGG